MDGVGVAVLHNAIIQASFDFGAFVQLADFLKSDSESHEILKQKARLEKVDEVVGGNIPAGNFHDRVREVNFDAIPQRLQS